MAPPYSTSNSLENELSTLGVAQGDGVFVHASLGAVGPLVGGPRAMVQALINSTGTDGLLAMPAFSTDAYFPNDIDEHRLSQKEISEIKHAVTGFDPATTTAIGMGVIAETFRNWPGTIRSVHPTSSVCLRGADASTYVSPHSIPWNTGPKTPIGRLTKRRDMKILFIGVGWNRCSALHAAETLASPQRTKMRRYKTGAGAAEWCDVPDVADDMNRLFPDVGAAFEQAGNVSYGRIGAATAMLCSYAKLVEFARLWVGAANHESGDRA